MGNGGRKGARPRKRVSLPPGSRPRSDLPQWGSRQWHAVVRPQNFAFYRKVETLYKFRVFSSMKDERRLREIIEQNTVHFSRADKLNDLFDMAVRHKITPAQSKAATRRRVLRDLERLMRAHVPALTEAEIQEHLGNARKEKLANFEQQATEQSRVRLANEFPIFCLSSDNRRPAQWAYYAADCSGVCIHFDARLESKSPFAFARMVEYQVQRPFLPIPMNLDHTEVARRIALVKHTDWKHEREYRVLGHSDIGINFRNFDGTSAQFEPALITGITVGTRMPQKRVAIIRRLAAQHAPAIPVFRAVPKRASFTCSIDPL
jgi:hypothetical protein